MRRAKRRVHEILEVVSPDDAIGRYLAAFLMVLIVANVVAVITGTVAGIEARYGYALYVFEVLSVAVFTVEYLLRLWACTEDAGFPGTVRGRLRYALTPLALVDLMAIAPFYLPMVIPLDLRVLRALRLFRLGRLFKMSRYSRSMITLGNVLRAKRDELAIVVVAVAVLLVLASSGMYFVEHEAQPEAFCSIPAAMWWGVVTLTTVGYGDIAPHTTLGKVFAGAIALLGIGMFALPAGVLASGFVEELRKERAEPTICPHCGRPIEPHVQ